MRLVVSRNDAAKKIGRRTRMRGDVIDILDEGQHAGVVGEGHDGWWIIDVPGESREDHLHLLAASVDDDGPNRLLQIDIVAFRSKLSEPDLSRFMNRKRIQSSVGAINFATRSR